VCTKLHDGHNTSAGDLYVEKFQLEEKRIVLCVGSSWIEKGFEMLRKGEKFGKVVDDESRGRRSCNLIITPH
jgi:hypothetical protein